MIARIAASNLPHVEARVMDGQALALEGASFDTVFSIFVAIMFAAWRMGLAAIARVTRHGGAGDSVTWRGHGASTHMLLAKIRGTTFHATDGMVRPNCRNRPR